MADVGPAVRALASVSDEVTLPQLRTLAVVSIDGPQTVSALAERLALNVQELENLVTDILDEMVGLGPIEP